MALLQKIQNLPRQSKIRIMWAVCVAVIILLAAVWVVAKKVSNKHSQAKDLLQNAHSKFNDDQNFYQKTLQDQGGTIPDSIKKLH
jgi:hypothetical protein